jgi:microcystin-dependent protein
MSSMSTAAPFASPDADGLVGGVTLWPSDTLPGPKYRFCTGDADSRADFSLLYSRIGTNHGTGDGSTTFNLPNYSGRVPVGVNTSDATMDEVGDTGGALSGAVNASGTTSSDGAHTHTTGNNLSGSTVQAGGGINVGSDLINTM